MRALDPHTVPSPMAGGESLPRAVVVEDDDAAVDAIRRLLLALGYSVAAEDVLPDALALLPRIATRPPPALVVLDICLPGGMDGIEALAAIRALPDCPAIPVVLVSGYGLPEHGAVEAIERGCASFTPKPIGASDMRAAIATARALASLWRVRAAICAC